MERMFDTKYLQDYLTNYGIKPSTIRIHVLEYLLKNRIHPTADDIYVAVSKKNPTLSRTSIYNTVDLFMKHNMIQVINTGENQNRYDINPNIHGHFACRICNKIYDFDINSKHCSMEQLDGFVIEEQNILFRGICKKCVEHN